jgi:prepilin-type N-terminal cleavage/methylation domain-containing protein
MRKSGFTLLELSIVLVIIGLIVGGVMTGSELIKQAELKSAVTDFQNYHTAVNAFKLKYNALPGDFPKAFDYFGSINSCTNNDVNVVSTGCNGNGNGRIIFIGGNSEVHRVFIHMNAAQVATNIYYSNLGTPTGGSSGNRFIYWMQYESWANTTPSNRIRLVLKEPLTGSKSALTPSEAKNLDLKLDDGLPTIGKIVARYGFDLTSGCYALAGADFDYTITSTALECILGYEF